MRRLVAAGLTVAAASGAAACASEVAIDEPEAALIARTRDTRATYSLISWSRIQRPGDSVVEEWAAEFHAGTRHRVETPRDEKNAPVTRFEQTLSVPQFADLDKLSATHRHGMLTLQLPIKDSVRPRRIEIQAYGEQKQLTGSAS